MGYKTLYLEAEKQLKIVEDEIKQAEYLRKLAEDERNQAEERLLQDEHQNQKTTFEEFIDCCHTFLSEPLKIQTDRKLTTKGSLTNPSGRYCPTYLRPWSDFHSLQQQVFDSAYRFLQPTGEAPSRLLPSRGCLQYLGESVCRQQLASEADLATYERSAVQNQVYDAIATLRSIPAAQEAFRLGAEIRFDNSSNASYIAENGDKILLYTVEYKPAHKLSAEYLRSGLREMNFGEDVIQRVKISNDGEERLKFNADQLTRAAVAQVYDGMIRDGLAYACLTNGYCTVFFHVHEDNPETLYYFLSEPKMDVETANDEIYFRHSKTAVGRMLCFCLMSVGSTPRSQEWRHRASDRLKKWTMDFDHALRQMSQSENATPPGSECIPSSSSVTRPPIKTRRYDLRSRPGSDVAAIRTSADSSDSDSNDAPSGPSNASGRKRNLSQRSSSPEQEQARRSKSRETRTGRELRPHSSWQYCTQGCLIGLRNKGYLDVHCPNVRLHRCGQKTDRHLIDSTDLARLIKQQLATDLDNYCTQWGWGTTGLCGAPFKLTLSSHGYTFVGKGTTDLGWKEVRREADVYRALRRAQGSAVPVFLGTVDLEMAYFLHGGADIDHMLLMSWGGERANLVKDEVELSGAFRRSVKEINELGVQHGDLHSANILWNSELGRVQIIDFHRSTLAWPQIRRLKRRLA